MLNTEDALASLDVLTQLSPFESYIGVVQHCRKERNLVHAKKIHAHICKNGLDYWLHDYLVPLFVDCGDISYANHMFSQAAYCSEHTWNSIIQGFVEHNRPNQALDLFHQMQSSSATPNKYTLVAWLKACTRLNNKEMGQQLQIEVAVNGFGNDPFVGTAMVYMYAKFNMMKEAQEFFDGFRARDTVSWNALMTGYLEHGLEHEAMHFLEQMWSEGVCPDVVTYVCSLKICSSLGSRNKGMEVHIEVLKSGLERDQFANNALVDMYSKLGLIEEAWKLFGDLQLQDVMSLTSLITACTDHDRSEQALFYLKQMQSKGLSADGVMFASSLKACGRIEDMQSGQEIHTEILKKGLNIDTFLGNSLVDMYIKCRLISEAEVVFDNLQERDIVSWNSLITGYADKGFFGKVHSCLDQMQADGVCPDDVTYKCCFRVCANNGDGEKGQRIYSEIFKRGFEVDGFVCSSLVDMHAKCDMHLEAREICRKFSSDDVVFWNPLIAEYIERGYVEDALECLEEVKQESINFDANTLVLSLKIFSSKGATASSHSIHSDIIKRGLDFDPCVGNSLVDVYTKCGSDAEAQKVFEKLVCRGVVSWNAIITGFIDNRCEEKLLGCLEEMHHEGLSPDFVTFGLVLRGLSMLKAIDKGREVHTYIIKKGLDEDVTIKSTLVSVYAECGSLEESMSVFSQIGVRDVVSWTALITGYADSFVWDEVLNCFEEMQLEQVAPDAIAWACFLKACSNKRELAVGQEIHAQIVKRGLEKEINTCNNLMVMYIKCGLALDASFHAPSLTGATVSAGYIGEDFEGELLDEFSSHLDHATLLHSLKACILSADLRGGQEVHNKVLKRGLDVADVFGNSLVDMYAQCNALEEAQIVVIKSSCQDFVLWNRLIKAFVENGAFEEALEQFEQMQIEGEEPDLNTYLLCSQACRNLGAECQGRELHVEIVKKGHDKDSAVSSNLLDMYGKSGHLLDAQKVFDDLLFRDVVSWTTLISGYVDCGFNAEAIRCSELMFLERVCANVVTYGCFVKLYSNVQNKNSCRQLHADIIKKGFEMEPFLCNSVLDMYLKCGLFTEILGVIYRLPDRNVIVFTTLIIGFYEHRKYEEALNVYMEMQQDNVSPNHVTYSYILNACGRINDWLLGPVIHLEIVKRGYEQDLVVGDSLIYMYASCSLFAEAFCVLQRLPDRDVVSWNLLIGACAEHGFTKEAIKYFHLMLYKGVSADEVLWNTIIMVYTEQGESENAFASFLQMLEQGVLPDCLIFISLSKACGIVSSMELGRRLHAQYWVASESQALQGSLACALIDMYGKCGCMLDAQHVFDATPLKDTIAWNVLLASCGRQGDSMSVFYVLDRMRQQAIDVYEATFLSVLIVCSHGGLVCEGQLLFETLSTEMTIISAAKYHTCIVDLLARAGQLEEAFAVIDRLPSPPDLLSFNSVLGACQRWEDVELGRHAFDFAMSLDEESVGSWVLISNVFARLG